VAVSAGVAQPLHSVSLEGSRDRGGHVPDGQGVMETMLDQITLIVMLVGWHSFWQWPMSEPCANAAALHQQQCLGPWLG